MQIQTILNHVEKLKGFIYEKVVMDRAPPEPRLLVTIRPRSGSKPYCSGCGIQGRAYDTLPMLSFQYVPLWGIMVFFVYAMRRVDCKRCGVTVEMVPWADGKHQLTRTFQWFLSAWAKKLSWKDVAISFATSWSSVFRAVEMAVEWGRARIDLSNVRGIGVDEIAWRLGHKYLTLVYQIDGNCRRLLWVGKDRSVRTLLKFFRWFGPEKTAKLECICSDMWKPYLKVIAKKASAALHVLDRFHIMSHFSKAIDLIRAGENRQLIDAGYEILKHSRWCLLKRQENLTEQQEWKLRDLLQFNLKSVRAYLLKEDFQQFWDYKSPWYAGLFLDRWCRQAMRSRLEPMKKVARMLRNHHELILNWFRAKKEISVGAVEGLNNKAKLTMRKAYGFRSEKTIEIALYHTLGHLPQPNFTHKFW